MAANALATVGRELANRAAVDAEAELLMGEVLGHPGAYAALNTELCAAIRAGDLSVETPGLLAVLQAMAKNQIAIDQPSYRPEGSI